MAKVEVELLRPLDGKPVGERVEFEQYEADRLAKFGAVKIVAKSSAAPSDKADAVPANKADAPSRGKRSK